VKLEEDIEGVTAGEEKVQPEVAYGIYILGKVSHRSS
jgi:hypothetical protein